MPFIDRSKRRSPEWKRRKFIDKFVPLPSKAMFRESLSGSIIFTGAVVIKQDDLTDAPIFHAVGKKTG